MKVMVRFVVNVPTDDIDDAHDIVQDVIDKGASCCTFDEDYVTGPCVIGVERFNATNELPIRDIRSAHPDVMDLVTTHFRMDAGFSVTEDAARMLYHQLRKDKGYVYLDSTEFAAELERAMSDVFGVGILDGKYRNISICEDE